MSNEYVLETVDRDSLGSKSVNKLRRQGLVPANFYMHGGRNYNLAIDKKVLNTALHSGSHLFVIKIDKKSHHVQLKDLQYHPVTEDVLHVDLQGFKMTETITLAVALHIIGEAPGLKEGGIMVQNINQIEISCLPSAVPEFIEVDISSLNIGEHVSVGDLELDEGIEVLSLSETPIASVQIARGPAEDEEVVEEEEDGEETTEDEETEETE